MQASVAVQESLEVQHVQQKTHEETQDGEHQEDAGALDSSAPSKKRGRVAKAKAKSAPGESSSSASTLGADATPEQLPMGEVVATAKASKKRAAGVGGEVASTAKASKKSAAAVGGEVESPERSKCLLPASQESDEGHQDQALVPSQESAQDEQASNAPAAYALLSKKNVRQAIKELDPDIQISPDSLRMLAQTLKASLDADVEHALKEEKKLLVATDALRQ